MFDWGGVISPAGTPDEVAVSLARILKVSPEDAREGFRSMAEAFKRGKITEQAFWAGLETRFSTLVPQVDRNIWTPVESFRPDARLVAYIQRLQNEGYMVSILSNTFPPTAEAIRATDWYDPFEIVILSSEVGFAKPDIAIYELLLDKTGYAASETIFIDDQEKCLAPARSLGMQTVLAESPTQIIQDVQTVLGEAS